MRCHIGANAGGQRLADHPVAQAGLPGDDRPGALLCPVPLRISGGNARPNKCTGAGPVTAASPLSKPRFHTTLLLLLTSRMVKSWPPALFHQAVGTPCRDMAACPRTGDKLTDSGPISRPYSRPHCNTDCGPHSRPNSRPHRNTDCCTGRQRLSGILLLADFLHRSQIF